MSNKLPAVTAETFDEKVLSNPLPVLVDFWAEWCGPCNTMSGILEALAEKYCETLSIVKVDIDDQPALTAQFGIMSIPTLLLFSNGKLLYRHSGTLSPEKLRTILKEELYDAN